MRTVLSLVLVAAIAAPVLAGQPKAKKKGPKRPDPGTMILKKLEKADLTDDQVAKIKELSAAVAEKMAAAYGNLTPDQRKARAEAIKKAKEEGKSPKEVMEAIKAAMTPDQKAAIEEARKAHGEMMKKVMALLTAEQKEKIGIKGPKGPRKKGGAKKGCAKKGGPEKCCEAKKKD